MIDVCLPGTGGMVPLPNRWLTCCWIEYQGAAILIDCGEGTQIALKEAGLKPGRIELLLITHFHADHVSGLPGLLLTLANSARTDPLTIAGPPGLKRIVSSLTVIAPRLPYPLDITELDRYNPAGDVLTENNARFGRAATAEKSGLYVSALPLSHSTTCFGYKAELFRKPVFNPQKAAALDIPVNLYKVLHGGGSVTLEDGRIIEPEQVLDGARKPISVCYLTDTQSIPAMTGFARGADLLISEGMYFDESMREKVESKGHMLFSDSAALAKNSGAKKLWLTHYSPALENPQYGIKSASRVFPEVTAGFDGIKTTLEG